MEHELDLVVIGWGKGGKTLAGTMARAGQRVAIVEASDQMYGGTCINIGCVRSSPVEWCNHLVMLRGCWG